MVKPFSYYLSQFTQTHTITTKKGVLWWFFNGSNVIVFEQPQQNRDSSANILSYFIFWATFSLPCHCFHEGTK